MNNSTTYKRPQKRTSQSGRGASKRGKQIEKKVQFSFPKKSFITLIVLGLVYFLLANSQNLYERVNTQKVERIVIDGSLDYVSEDEIKNAVFRFIDQSMVVINLDEIKLELEKNPWIKAVGLQREWPSTLKVTVEEEMAIARWGEQKLLNQEGEIFSPLTVLNQTHLPSLFGPVDSEQVVMEQYQQFNEILYPQGLKIASLDLNSRNAWTLELESGAKLKIGNSEMVKRMRRFVESLDGMLLGSFESINSIDLRYSNGIAVSRKANANEDVVSL